MKVIQFFLYKTNSTVDGWLPKPFEKTEKFGEVDKVFSHPDPSQGAPVRCEKYPGSSSSNAERGKRQHWFYKVRYAQGATLTWPLKCVGIPIKFPPDISDIIMQLLAQAFVGSLCTQEHRDTVLNNIRSMLTARSGAKLILFAYILRSIVDGFNSAQMSNIFRNGKLFLNRYQKGF